MFLPSPTSELDALAARYPQMTHETYVFIEKLVGLPESSQRTIMNFLREVVEGFGDVEPGSPAFPGRSPSAAEPAGRRKRSGGRIRSLLVWRLRHHKKIWYGEGFPR